MKCENKSKLIIHARDKRTEKKKQVNTLKRMIKKLIGYAGWRLVAVPGKIRKANRQRKVKKTKREEKALNSKSSIK